MVDTSTPHGQIFETLARKLHDRRTGRAGAARWNRGLLDNKVDRPPLDVLDAYFRGDPPLRSDMHSDWKPYVRAALRAGRFLIAEKTVTATSNRMDLRDFRTSQANDEQGDAIARDIMRANQFDIVSVDTHDFMLSLGDGYVITQPGKNSKYARATAEDPRQVITGHDSLTGDVMAGLKMYRDEWDAADHAIFALRLGDGSVAVQKFIAKGLTTIGGTGRFRMDGDRWELDGEEQDSPFGLMPFDRFRNRFGVAEFERHLDTLDRINDKVFNEWWISKVQAFRQRAVKNLPDTETVLKDGVEVEEEIDYTDMFTSAPDEMWRVPEGVEFWESLPIDLTPITASVQKDLERYAAAVDLPLHTITPDAANGSAEGATLMREEHVFHIGDRIKRVKRPWCSVAAKLFAFTDDPEAQKRADVTQIEAMFGPAERYSLEQKASAASQVAQVYPIEGIWTDIMQVPPAEVERLRTLKGRDRFYTAGGTPPPAAPPTPGPGSVLPVFQPPVA